MKNKPLDVRYSLAAALLLGSLGQSAFADVLLDENFNGAPATYTPIFGGDAGASSINTRFASNAINTGTDSGFDSFFDTSSAANQFLVLGDVSGDLGGPPDGSSLQLGALSMAQFGLGAFAAGTHSLQINFDYAFDTNLDPAGTEARSPDSFYAFLGADIDAGFSVPPMLYFTDVMRNEANRKGMYSQTITFTLADADTLYLAFGVSEDIGEDSSAAGIDNILVESVPVQVLSVPESETYAMMLAGLGLVGFMVARRNRA